MYPKDKLQIKPRYQLDSFLAECGIEDHQNKSIFEVGFKNGHFLNECLKAGLRPTGIEISKEFYEETKAKYPDLDLLWYDGGTFPVSDESFDLVVSFQVLEHVGSTEHMFDECLRILKPGGIMYHTCPNYRSFYEGHYQVIWLPFFNKSMGRLYLKALGRLRPAYDRLNLVTPRTVSRALRRHQGNIAIVSLGRTEFINKFNKDQVEKVQNKRLRTILRLFTRLSFIKIPLLRFICWADLYYPLTVIVRKNR